MSALHTDDQDLDGPVLFARVCDGKGGGRSIGWTEAQVWQPGAPGEFLWIHLCRNHPAAADWLEHGLRLPEPTVEVLTSESTRPRAFREGETLVAVLRGINFNPDAEPEDMVSMQLWCDGHRLVTLRRRKLQTPRDILATIDAGRGPNDPGRTITDLIEAMIGRMGSSIVDMNDAIDAMEDADLDQDTGEKLRRISMIRRNGLALQRHMAPQHEALETIARDAPTWFERHDRREIAESIDRLRRYLDDIDISKESAVVLQDDIRARSDARAERTNYLLTIVAAIFLPLTFITGLLGINVGGIPGSAHENAFWIVCAICGVILIAQVILFWKWKWL